MPKPYLIQRPSGLYARFLVPVDLRAAIGSRFLVRRLPPSTSDLARLAAARMAVALCQAFARMRQGAMADWKKELRDTLAGDISTWSGSISLPNGAKLTDLQVNGREDAQALLDTIKGMGGASFVANLPPTASTETLGDRVALYLGDLRNAKTSKGNQLDSNNTLAIFCELIGSGVPMVAITETHARTFLTALYDWPANARKKADYRGKTAPQIIAKVKRQRADNKEVAGLSDRTHGKHRDRLASFFNAQVAAGLLSRSPLDGIKRANAAAATPTLPRRPFTIEEVGLVFDLEAYLPWSQGRPDRYWGPLLAAGTGARVNEVAQLYVDDVEEVAGIWGIHIRASRPDQKLKNANSLRFVPLHPRLEAAGFVRYVEDAKAAGHARLFPHLPWHSKAGYGDAMGDQFRAYLLKREMTQAGLGFHSFRHTAGTRLHYAGVLNTTVAAITGHLAHMPGELGTYVQVPTLPARADAVALLPVPKGLPVYNKGDFMAALQDAHAKAKRLAVNRAARKRRDAAQAKTAKS